MGAAPGTWLAIGNGRASAFASLCLPLPFPLPFLTSHFTLSSSEVNDPSKSESASDARPFGRRRGVGLVGLETASLFIGDTGNSATERDGRVALDCTAEGGGVDFTGDTGNACAAGLLFASGGVDSRLGFGFVGDTGNPFATGLGRGFAFVFAAGLVSDAFAFGGDRSSIGKSFGSLAFAFVLDFAFAFPLPFGLSYGYQSSADEALSASSAAEVRAVRLAKRVSRFSVFGGGVSSMTTGLVLVAGRAGGFRRVFAESTADFVVSSTRAPGVGATIRVGCLLDHC